MIITLDGPAASGKSTIARLLARSLGYYYLYSGLIYRAYAYILLTEYDFTRADLTTITQDDITVITPDIRYAYTAQEGEKVFWRSIDITQHLTTAQISNAASIASTHAFVRNEINTLLQTIAAHHSIIADGRDMGSVVFKDADYKFYLTASLPVRAQRWMDSQLKLGNNYTLQQAHAIIQERDDRDMGRSCAPLHITADAQVIDSSALTIEQTLDKLLLYI